MFSQNVKKLLQHTAKAEIKEAEVVIQHDHSLILKKESFTEEWCGQREWKKPISPLEYSAWCGDTELRRLYLGNLPDPDKYEAYLQLKEIRDKGTEHGMPLLPVHKLIQSWKQYIKEWHKLPQLGGDPRLRTQWQTQHSRLDDLFLDLIGKLQRHSLVNLLQWYCSATPFLNPVPDFSQYHERTLFVINRDEDFVLDLSVNSELGVKYGLYKGLFHSPLTAKGLDLPDIVGGNCYLDLLENTDDGERNVDIPALEKFYNVRSKELLEDIENLLTPEVLFRVIYESAKKEDIASIQAILPYVCIDFVTKSGSPITQLAFEGNTRAIEFLQSQFDSSISLAAYGYAKSGNKTEIEKLKHFPTIKNDPKTLEDILSDTLIGYMESGHTYEEFERLSLPEVKITPELKKILLINVASAYARLNQNNKIKTLLQRSEVKNDLELKNSILDNVFYEYAKNGYCKDLTRDEINKKESVRLLRAITSGFAASQSVAEVKEMLKLEMKQEDRISLLRETAFYYARHGYSSDAKDHLLLSEIKSNPTHRKRIFHAIAMGMASGGFKKEAKKLYHLPTNLNEQRLILITVAEGYIRKGHIEAVNELFSWTSNSEHRNTLMKIVLSNLIKNKFFTTEESTLKVLVTFDTNVQQAIHKELQDSKEINFPVDKLIPKAAKLSQVMKTQNLNFRQALAWINPDIRMWFLQYQHQFSQPRVVENKPITPTSDDISNSIALYLSSLTESEAIALSSKMKIHFCAARFFKYYSNHPQSLNDIMSFKNRRTHS